MKNGRDLSISGKMLCRRGCCGQPGAEKVAEACAENGLKTGWQRVSGAGSKTGSKQAAGYPCWIIGEPSCLLARRHVILHVLPGLARSARQGRFRWLAGRGGQNARGHVRQMWNPRFSGGANTAKYLTGSKRGHNRIHGPSRGHDGSAGASVNHPQQHGLHHRRRLVRHVELADAVLDVKVDRVLGQREDLGDVL